MSIMLGGWMYTSSSLHIQHATLMYETLLCCASRSGGAAAIHAVFLPPDSAIWREKATRHVTSTLNSSQLNLLLTDFFDVPKITGEVDIRGNQFVRNTARNCAFGSDQLAMLGGGALELLADNVTLQGNLVEENEACGCA
jgi:hypothetical protein